MTSTDITTAGDRVPEVPAAKSIIAVIERAVLNPDVDIDKVERLLQVQERIIDRQAKADYTTALAEMQPDLPVTPEKGAIKNRAGEIQSTYPKWEDISDDIRPVLHAHGFALNFRIENLENDRVIVYAILSHRSGYSEETPSPAMAADTSGSKNAIQAQKSTVSYGKRISAQAILNLTSRGDDDDGGAGGAGPTVSPEQFSRIQNLIAETGAKEAALLKYYNAASLEQFPAAKFDAAVEQLEAKKTKGAA